MGSREEGVTRLFIRRRSPSCQSRKPQRDLWVGVCEFPPYPVPTPGPGPLSTESSSRCWSRAQVLGSPQLHLGTQARRGRGLSSSWVPWRQWGGMRGWCPGHKGETGRGLEPAVPAGLGPRPPWLAHSPPPAQTPLQSAWSHPTPLQMLACLPSHQHPSTSCPTPFLSGLKKTLSEGA